jgi:Mg2+ and Co2+ transporter CorA
MLSNITQNDAEYTAAIAVDGKRDSIAMRTISILGIVYLPPTFVATLFSVDMFDWGPSADGNGAM